MRDVLVAERIGSVISTNPPNGISEKYYHENSNVVSSPVMLPVCLYPVKEDIVAG